LSQEELAGRSGISVRAISDLERGRTRWPRPDSVQRLADALELEGEARAEFAASAARRLAASAGIGQRHPRGVVPRQLPRPVPGFTGRAAELALLSRVLTQPGGTAVITAIGGAAGVGKTALAVHWGHLAAGHFPDGQLFVNLRGFDPSGSPVPAADAIRVLLEALNVPADRLPVGDEAQAGLYRSLLAGRRMLVILDNARDEAQVRPLLPGALTCRVVVTSRNQLTGLAATEAARPLMLDMLTEAEARELLQYRLGDERLAAAGDAAARIIRSSAGLPLALSVIAARAMMGPHLTLGQIAAALASGPALSEFTAGEPAADVRAVFSWSCRQLAPDAARVFRLAGLHPGADFDTYAVAALAGMPLADAGAAVAALERGCLIQSVGPGRYAMHDLLRGYARERAAAEDSQHGRQAALTHLLDYYLYTSAAAMDAAYPDERHLRPRIPEPGCAVPPVAGPAAARAWLDAERHSLVAAGTYAASNGWDTHAARLSLTITSYLHTGRHIAEAVALHEHACRAARRAGDQMAEARAFINLGGSAMEQGALGDAMSYCQEALELGRLSGDRQAQARALILLGVVRRVLGRWHEAAEDWEHAAALYQSLGERRGQAHAYSNLGVISRHQGRCEQAIGYQERALALFREIGSRPGEALVFVRIGGVRLEQGEYPGAVASFEQALAVYSEDGDLDGEGKCLTGLGQVHSRLGDYPQAVGYLQRALRLARDTNDIISEAEVLNRLGEMFLAMGSPDQARVQFAAARAIAQRIGIANEHARACRGLGDACHALGDVTKAKRNWRQAHAIYTRLGVPDAEEVGARLEQQSPAPPPAS
jgi:tetratricopeptide (TPR) repeat protein